MAANKSKSNDQAVLYKTERKSTTHPFAKIWAMRCGRCSETYGSNSCDAHIRRCPHCDGGRPGEPLV
jgi:hypothetical protein